jgi:hypothetical protein
VEMWCHILRIEDQEKAQPIGSDAVKASRGDDLDLLAGYQIMLVYCQKVSKSTRYRV